MGRRGRKRRLDVESEYWLLLRAGVGTVEACKRVGVGRKTGYRWRAENGGLPPAALSEGVRSQRYLSLLERQRIAAASNGLVPRAAINRYQGSDPKRYHQERARDRSRLFVAATRARDDLAVFWHGTRSPFIPERLARQSPGT